MIQNSQQIYEICHNIGGTLGLIHVKANLTSRRKLIDNIFISKDTNF